MMVPAAHTHVLSHIQEGQRSWASEGGLRGRLGTLGRIVVMVLPEIRELKEQKALRGGDNKSISYKEQNNRLIILRHLKLTDRNLVREDACVIRHNSLFNTICFIHDVI